MLRLHKHGEALRLVRAVKVRKITSHGLRHTYATLAQPRVPPKVVQERLGREDRMTLEPHAHAVGGIQQQAAERIGAVPHGTVGG